MKMKRGRGDGGKDQPDKANPSSRAVAAERRITRGENHEQWSGTDQSKPPAIPPLSSSDLSETPQELYEWLSRA